MASSAKTAKLDGSQDVVDEVTQKSLEDIDVCQNELDKLNEQASEEILHVEQKYNKLRKPYFEKRSGLIAKIPDFWFRALTNHPQIGIVIDEEEEECLRFLAKIEVEEFEDIKSGYQLKLHFDDKNPFFENKLLCKEFHLAATGDPESKSDPIRWKEGKNLSLHPVAPGKTATKRKLPDRSFFAWYEDNGDPAGDDIAEAIKDELWPNPLQYFLAPDPGQNGYSDDEDFDGEVVDEEFDDEDAEAENDEDEGAGEDDDDGGD